MTRNSQLQLCNRKDNLHLKIIYSSVKDLEENQHSLLDLSLADCMCYIIIENIEKSR